MISGRITCIWLLPLLVTSPCGRSVGKGAGAPAQSALAAETARLRDDSNGKDWPGYGRTFGEQHYSPLNEINAENVNRLGLAWFMDLGVGNPVTVPVEADGVLYFASGHSIVHAVDASTGKLLWIYDSKAAELAGRRLRISWGSRGIAYWNGKVYTGTTDGRLIAIDAQNGSLFGAPSPSTRMTGATLPVRRGYSTARLSSAMAVQIPRRRVTMSPPMMPRHSRPKL